MEGGEKGRGEWCPYTVEEEAKSRDTPLIDTQTKHRSRGRQQRENYQRHQDDKETHYQRYTLSIAIQGPVHSVVTRLGTYGSHSKEGGSHSNP